ncbi:MAG: transglutaminase family protein [Yoonia sp.]|uniref:transglutaminase family protein n=1 Tax=Yoonia sp. TaxID=2212373 RepID=UPI00273F92F3|nr:transglutaminase family protein [Yoonia sp.]MDP5084166.1 transglutaminase family protein [Yoonia sp.]
MRLQIRHTTTYRYDQPVDYALQKVRLTPQRVTVQDVLDWRIEVTGGKSETHYTDQYGNHVDLVNVDVGATEVKIVAAGTVITNNATGVLGPVYGRAPLWHFRQPTLATAPNDGIRDLAAGFGAQPDQIAALHALSDRIINAVPYQVGVTNSHTVASEALEIGAGVCQDHAQIFIAAVRSEGIPARYVSGYLMINDQIEQEATHAWAEAHVDGLGWVGFDVSNGVSSDEKYVRIAVGRDARDAAPTEGMRLGNSTEQMIVSLQVQQ